jgi:hypothetical protein
LNTD